MSTSIEKSKRLWSGFDVAAVGCDDELVWMDLPLGFILIRSFKFRVGVLCSSNALLALFPESGSDNVGIIYED